MGEISASPGSPSQQPLSKGPLSTRPPADGRLLLGILGCLFLVAGSTIFYFLTVRTFFQVQSARHWVETPAVVVASEVKSHSGSKGSTYSVHITYRYEVNGRSHQADRYDFLGGSFSGYNGKAKIVRQYPPGRKITCFVNPANPADAVLVRGFVPMMLIFGLLLPVTFIAFGAGMIAVLLRGQTVRGTYTPDQPSYSSPGPVELKPKVSPILKVVGAVLIALFWNGIDSVFVWQAVKGWQQGHPDYFLTIFLIPFVLIGLALIGAIFYFLLALGNPRPVLALSSSCIPLGGQLSVDWKLMGRAEAVQRLRLWLEGREEAVYQRGTSTYTDKAVFTSIPIADSTSAFEIESGRCTVTLPASTMHSFKAKYNRIIWTLKLSGEIPRWPDVSEEFEITVTPS